MPEITKDDESRSCLLQGTFTGKLGTINKEWNTICSFEMVYLR
jgi:hypothetical protein